MKLIHARAAATTTWILSLYATVTFGQLLPVTPAQQPADQQPPAFPQPSIPQQLGFPQPQPGLQQQGTPQPGIPQQPSGQLPHAGNLPNAPRSNAYANLPAVTIREFRSSVPDITARGATDMFITALVKTRKFRVLERARMSEGIAAEKALNQQGMTTGDVGQSKYVGAGYMFEATISGLSADVEKKSMGLSIGGLGAKKSSSKDILAIDVRVIDIESGIVLDSIDVRKDMLGEETSVGGVTTLLANLLTRGRGSALTDALAPSDDVTSGRKDSLDNTLRAAIEEAVAEIARRFGNDSAQSLPAAAAVPVPQTQ